MKVGVLSRSLGKNCGLSEYAKTLYDTLIEKNKWEVEISRRVSLFNGYDAVFIQYEPALYGSISEIIAECLSSNIRVPIVDSHVEDASFLGPLLSVLVGRGYVCTKVPTHLDTRVLRHLSYPSVPSVEPPEALSLATFGLATPNKRFELIIDLAAHLELPLTVVSAVADAIPVIETISSSYLQEIKAYAEAKGGKVSWINEFLPREDIVKELQKSSHLISATEDWGRTTGSMRVMALAGRPIVSLPSYGANEVGAVVVDDFYKPSIDSLKACRDQLPSVPDTAEDYFTLLDEIQEKYSL